MEAAKRAVINPGGSRIRMAGDLLWFAAASLGAGLLAAIAAAALVVLLARPSYASEAGDFTRPAAREIDEGGRAFVLVLGREAELDALGLECDADLADGADPAEQGFMRLLDRERRELRDLLRRVYRARFDFGIADELTAEAHFIRLPGAEDVAGEHVAHCLVYADQARDALRAAAARAGAEPGFRLAGLR